MKAIIETKKNLNDNEYINSLSLTKINSEEWSALTSINRILNITVIEGKEMTVTVKEPKEVLFKIIFRGCVNRINLVRNLLQLHGYKFV